ncbi:hypothetical protein PR001_g20976 [Phytophthora rubi]|uniref:Uncharacterized protein n=1 Tax=Phytophthora rubi TaxID=129364 RepID=A0A6A3JCB1_9STRA|nr:hypothetical protein PR001_g20976 [Phytophthora rubi]
MTVLASLVTATTIRVMVIFVYLGVRLTWCHCFQMTPF